jgi:hypothetical protein
MRPHVLVVGKLIAELMKMICSRRAISKVDVGEAEAAYSVGFMRRVVKGRMTTLALWSPVFV